MAKVCIIGSGLGGLTAGALLAKDGYEVVVLEQHYSIGGSATAFKRKGFNCEVGLHEMDGAFAAGSKKKIFEKLGVYENLEFVRVPEFFRTMGSEMDIVVPDNVDQAKEELKKHFPEQKVGIDAYFKLIEDLANEFKDVMRAKWYKTIFFPVLFPLFYKYRNTSTLDAISELISDQKLILLLNSNVGYYHDRIDELSFIYHALGQYSYFSDGGWYIKGGSQKLSDYLGDYIKSHNGRIITRAEVHSIRSSKGQSRVEYISRKLQGVEDCDIVLSNASPMSTYKMYGIDQPQKMSEGVSLATVYLGFNKKLVDVYGPRAYSTFFFKNIKDVDQYHSSLKDSIETRGFVFVDYSQIDSGLNGDDKSFAVMCTVDYLKDWENLDKESYKEKKQLVIDSFLDELEKEYPNIKDYLVFAELGTAKTMKRYLFTPKGTAYGFAPTIGQFLRRRNAKSKTIDNLYFTGAWLIGGGFTPSINSGGLAYKTIIKNHPVKS